MSVFCGKCDFYDSYCMIHGDGDEKKIEKNLKKLQLYVHGKDGRDHRVKSDTIKDIAKYYPYLCMMSYGNKDGESIYILQSDSFIDLEEKEHRNYYIRDALKYWRKCKRNKTAYDPKECFKAINFSKYDNPPIEEICKRIETYGDKAEFDDIHFSMWEHNRRRWFEELVRLGYTEQEAYDWCFKGLLDSPELETKRLGKPVKK